MPIITYQASLEEVPRCHTVPAVVVGITDDEAGEYKEEVHGQVAVVQNLVGRPCGIGFKKMESYHDYCGYAAKPVQYFVTRLGC